MGWVAPAPQLEWVWVPASAARPAPAAARGPDAEDAGLAGWPGVKGKGPGRAAIAAVRTTDKRSNECRTDAGHFQSRWPGWLRLLRASAARSAPPADWRAWCGPRQNTAPKARATAAAAIRTAAPPASA